MDWIIFVVCYLILIVASLILVKLFANFSAKGNLLFSIFWPILILYAIAQGIKSVSVWIFFLFWEEIKEALKEMRSTSFNGDNKDRS